MQITDQDKHVVAIAEAFAEVLRQWLSKDEFDAMKRLNETDRDYADGGACASHNYCDANMAMGAAFEQVIGRDAPGNSAEDTAIWNDAWSLARKLYLGTQE